MTAPRPSFDIRLKRAYEPAAAVEPGRADARQCFDQHAMLRHGEDVRALGLAVPARDARQSMRDVFQLDVERRGVEQIEPPPR